jgi:ParB family chromosome partitioning protein
VKLAKTKGVEEALRDTPKLPHTREFNEIEMTLKKLQKKLKQLEIEGITLEHFPSSTQKIFNQVVGFANFGEDKFYPKDLTCMEEIFQA